jgi:hypothetical protein
VGTSVHVRAMCVYIRMGEKLVRVRQPDRNDDASRRVAVHGRMEGERRASNRSLYPDRRTGFKSSIWADLAMRGSAISFVTRKSNALSDSFLVLFFFMEKRSNTSLLSGHLFKEITCTILAFPFYTEIAS